MLPDGREALWETDSAQGLEAQLLRGGVMVGFVPVIEGSEGFTDEQVVDAIARTDYDRPECQPARAAPPADGASRNAGTLRRFIEVYRE
jgi:hypothetical protein